MDYMSYQQHMQEQHVVFARVAGGAEHCRVLTGNEEGGRQVQVWVVLPADESYLLLRLCYVVMLH